MGRITKRFDVIDNPLGKIFTTKELKIIADICVQNNILIISDEVYDRLFYVPFTRIATLSPEVERITLTLSSAGKNFYATGWRVGKISHDMHFGGARFVG